MPNVQHFVSKGASCMPGLNTFQNATAATFSLARRSAPMTKIAAPDALGTSLRLVVEETG